MLRQPGCFGIPSVFSVRSPKCNTCASANACVSVSRTVLSRIGDPELILTFSTMVAVNDPVERVAQPRPLEVKVERATRARWAPTPTQKALIDSVPAAVGKMMRAMFRKETFIAQALANGENPFPNDSQRTASTMYLLLSNRVPVSKAQAKAALQSALGWASSSASVQASLIWRVFKELGIGVEDAAGLMTLNPRIDSNTTKLYYHNES